MVLKYNKYKGIRLLEGLMNKFTGKGIIASVITPFYDDDYQKINFKELQRLLKYLLKKRVDGIFISSGAGEFSSLSFNEKKLLIETAVNEVGGKLQIYAGTGSVTTKETLELTKIAESNGCDAVSIMPPYSILPNNEELYNHYKEIAEKTKIPIVLYNFPKKTGISLSTELVARLIKIDAVTGIKDSSGDFATTLSYIRLQNEKFSTLAGIDMYIYAALSYGAKGSISSTAGVIPEYATQIYESYQKKDYENAKKKQNELYPFRAAYSLGTFPSILKSALNIMGFSVGQPRKPILPLNRDSNLKLIKILKDMSII